MKFGTLGEQNIGVSINGHELFQRHLNSDHIEIEQAFPKDWILEGVNRIDFELPNARMPGNGDRRYLAISFRQLQLR